MSTVGIILVGVAILVGLVGILVPLLPGSILVFGAILVWALFERTTVAWVTNRAGGGSAGERSTGNERDEKGGGDRARRREVVGSSDHSRHRHDEHAEEPCAADPEKVTPPEAVKLLTCGSHECFLVARELVIQNELPCIQKAP